MKKIGLIVNPIAGMGGAVGLKGTDGEEILRRARDLGAIPGSPEKARRALRRITSIKDSVEILTCSGMMGEDEARDESFSLKVVCETGKFTTSSDTKNCAKIMLDEGVDLLIFVGGDGTARDICEIVGERITVLGVPAGVKMYSSCFGITPEASGDLALFYLSGERRDTSLAEVLDVDETMFRKGILSTRLYCYLKIPSGGHLVQNAKASSRPESEKAQREAIAEQVIESLEAGHYYIVGPGTTTKEILKRLGFETNVLGVDILHKRKDGKIELIGSDLNEESIQNVIAKEESGAVHLIVTPLGGQGFILGRGNQQLSSRILEMVGKEGIIIVATESKITSIPHNSLLIDSGNPETDRKLSGYYRIITGYHLFSILEAKSWH